MKIVLLKDHWQGGTHHAAGKQLEVDEVTYNQLMAVYMADKKVKVEENQQAQGVIDALQPTTVNPALARNLDDAGGKTDVPMFQPVKKEEKKQEAAVQQDRKKLFQAWNKF